MFTVLFSIPHGKSCLLLSDMLNISKILYLLVSLGRNFGICTKFTTLHLYSTLHVGTQQTKVGLQRDTKNAAELLSCFKGTLTNAVGFTVYSFVVSVTGT